MKQYNVVNAILTLINPFLGFFSSLFDILKQRDSCIFFAFSLAIIAVYFPIMYDTSNNFYVAYFLQYNPSLLGFSQPYISIPSYLMQNYGIDFYYFIFFNIFFVIYTWSKIVSKFFYNSRLNYTFIFIFIFLVFTFNYRDLLDLNRNIFSYSILFYYIFLIKNKNILSFLIFALLSCWFHSSALIIVVLYLISNLKFDYRLNYFILFSSLGMGVILPNFISNLESILVNIPVFGASLNYYLYGEDFGVQVFSMGTLLKKILNCSIIFLVCVIVNNNIKNYGNDKLQQFILLIGCVSLLFFSFVTFFERFNLAFNFAFIYILSKNISLNAKIAIAFLVFFRSICVYFLIYFPIFLGDYSGVMDNKTKNEMIIKPFYYPTLFLLDIHNNGYSDEVISSSVIWGR